MVSGGAGELDARVRTAAFAFLAEQTALRRHLASRYDLFRKTLG
jgi:hypothetical protein